MNVRVSLREEAADYPAVVATIDAKWRVIACRDGIQWILQRRAGQRNGRPRFEAQAYCRSREGIIAAVRRSTGQADPKAIATLENLPDWIGKGGTP